MVDPTHEIRFPVADVRILFDDCRTLINIDAVRYFPAPILLTVAFATFLSPGNTQLPVQVATMLLSCQMCW